MGFVMKVDADVPEGRALHLIDVENLAGDVWVISRRRSLSADLERSVSRAVTRPTAALS